MQYINPFALLVQSCAKVHPKSLIQEIYCSTSTMLSLHYLSLLLPLLPLSLAAVNGPCSIDGTPGVCVTTANCAAIDGSFRSGFCKNDVENVKCCIKPECGSGGNCRPTNTCDGTTKTGLCPGSSNFKCCEPKAGGNPPPPPPSGGGATTGDLKLSAKGVNFIAGFEGFRANYYNDAVVSLLYRWRFSHRIKQVTEFD